MIRTAETLIVSWSRAFGTTRMASLPGSYCNISGTPSSLQKIKCNILYYTHYMWAHPKLLQKIN